MTQVKLLVVSKCMRHLLEPLRLASYDGLNLKAPNGGEYTFFPRLLSFVGDDPEVGCPGPASMTEMCALVTQPPCFDWVNHMHYGLLCLRR